MRSNMVAAIFYVFVYIMSIWQLTRDPFFALVDTLSIFFIFGVIFSGIAVLITRGVTPPTIVVLAPQRELRTITIYLVLFSVFILGFVFSAIKRHVEAGVMQELILLFVKLTFMVVLPALLLKRYGYSWRELLQWKWPKKQMFVLALMMLLMGGLQVMAGRGLAELRDANIAITTIAFLAVPAFLWMTVEAGLCEEFLFRYALQTRLSAELKNSATALVLMAIIFGLAHAPGYYLRDAHVAEGMQQAPSLLSALAYSVAVVSPIGLIFGVLWARTGNFWLLVILHGWIDWLPNVSSFIRTWH